MADATAGDFFAGKTAVQVLFPDIDIEAGVTRQLLALVPMDKLDWKPHPKSMTLRALASHVASLPGFTTAMAAMDVLNFDPAAWKPKAFSTSAELLGIFDEELTAMKAAVNALDTARLAGTWQMKMGDQVIVEGKRAELIRHMGINHLVHHRAQLGVYLRLLEVPIPGSYGPSADTM